jgi:hypothetical protein
MSPRQAISGLRCDGLAGLSSSYQIAIDVSGYRLNCMASDGSAYLNNRNLRITRVPTPGNSN